jgi:hypothetical protein
VPAGDCSGAGRWWGGELEIGTSQFVWMQSITRSRWLTVKVGWALLATAVWGGAVSALVTWWSSPVNAPNHQNFQPGQFDIQGIETGIFVLLAAALMPWRRSRSPAVTPNTQRRITAYRGVGARVPGLARWHASGQGDEHVELELPRQLGPAARSLNRTGRGWRKAVIHQSACRPR